MVHLQQQDALSPNLWGILTGFAQFQLILATGLGHSAIHARNILKWFAFLACLSAFAAAGCLIDSYRLYKAASPTNPAATFNYIVWGLDTTAGFLSYAVCQIYIFADKSLCGRRVHSGHRKDVERQQAQQQAFVPNQQDEMLQAPDLAPKVPGQGAAYWQALCREAMSFEILYTSTRGYGTVLQ
jgi:hypothetical protein